jgi:PPOX class probable F420-dependent enzyme
VARLATVNAAGDADLVPVTFAVVNGDTLVTAVDHKPKSTTALARLDNVRRHPVVTVLVDHYSDDWSSLWWVRLRGPASVVDPGGAGHAEAVDALAARYEQYRGRPPAGPAIVVDVREVRGWAAVGSGPDE